MKVSPPIQPGRRVLRRDTDGKFTVDYIFLALVVRYIRNGNHADEIFREDAVPLWGSSRKRVAKGDFWVNFVRGLTPDGKIQPHPLEKK